MSTLVQPPSGWQWDTSIKDFKTLRDNVNRYCSSQSGPVPKGSVGTLAVLGDMDLVRKHATSDFLGAQLPNGLFQHAVDTFRMYQWSHYTMHELFIKVRSEMAGYINLKKIPPYPLSYLHPLVNNPSQMVSWIETLPWDNPWATGNLDMDIAFQLAFEWKVMGNGKAKDTLDVWFNWHDSHFDKDSFWDPKGIGNLLRNMAGAMHQYGIYFLFNHDIPAPDKAILATISLQQKTGLFAFESYSNNCIDIDAVFIIANLYNKYKVCEKEVKECLEKVFEANLKVFLPEGGAVNRVGMEKKPDWWSTLCRVQIAGWCARILGIPEYQGPWSWVHRHPFISEDGGLSVPDWTSDAWYDVTDWPRPAK